MLPWEIFKWNFCNFMGSLSINQCCLNHFTQSIIYYKFLKFFLRTTCLNFPYSICFTSFKIDSLYFNIWYFFLITFWIYLCLRLKSTQNHKIQRIIWIAIFNLIKKKEEEINLRYIKFLINNFISPYPFYPYSYLFLLIYLSNPPSL